jgi:hypothetical protein
MTRAEELLSLINEVVNPRKSPLKGSTDIIQVKKFLFIFREEKRSNSNINRDVMLLLLNRGRDNMTIQKTSQLTLWIKNTNQFL